MVVHAPARKLAERVLVAEKALASDVVGVVVAPILKTNAETHQSPPLVRRPSQLKAEHGVREHSSEGSK